MKLLKSPFFLLVVFLVTIAIVTTQGPPEETLGTNVRVVYLHGAWVWVALIMLILAGAAGLIGIVFRRPGFHAVSRALGRTGLLFWITYLPISLWAMQANWNGLFLAEPRWRIAFVFSVGGLLLQIGLTLIEDLRWASVINIGFVVGLFLAIQTAEQVMHPPSPIFDSDASGIQMFFLFLTALTFVAATQLARWLYQFEKKTEKAITFPS